MLYNDCLIGRDIYLKCINTDYVNENYVSWLNDTSINSYIEPRLVKQTLDSVRKYVKDVVDSDDNYLFGIFKDDKHIGNIQITSIHPVYECARIGYVIGDKTSWHKGVATQAIGLVAKFSFEILKLHRLEAVVFEQNIPSQKALLKNGFVKEGILRKKVKITKDSPWNDYFQFGLLREDWIKLANK